MPANAIDRLIKIGECDIFHDGIDSEFSRQLGVLLSKYDNILLIETISEIISKGLCSPSVAAEFLTQLENYSHSLIISDVYQLLLTGLNSKHLEVRDSALNALGSMGKHESIAPLREAIKREKNSELREDMKVILIELLELQSLE